MREGFHFLQLRSRVSHWGRSDAGSNECVRGIAIGGPGSLEEWIDYRRKSSWDSRSLQMGELERNAGRGFPHHRVRRVPLQSRRTAQSSYSDRDWRSHWELWWLFRVQSGGIRSIGVKTCLVSELQVGEWENWTE
jgi:hypothetical protein